MQVEMDALAGDGKTAVTEEEKGVLLVEYIDTKRIYEVDDFGNVTQIIITEDANPGDITKGQDGKDLDGSEEKPFEIWSIEDLVYFEQTVDRDSNSYSGKYVKLMQTLDFNANWSYSNPNTIEYDSYLGGDGNTGLKEQLTNGNGFISIGYRTAFSGTFEGNNNQIKHINLNQSIQNTYFGLFSRVNNGAINDLKISGNINVSNDAYAYYFGGMVGYIYYGTLNNCSSSMNIEFNKNGRLGGLVGYSSYSLIENCSFTGSINATAGYEIGGLVAYAYSSNYTEGFIKNSYNEADITVSTTYADVGGVVADKFYVNVYNCYNKGNINYTSNSTTIDSYIGGIIGRGNSYGLVLNCYNTGNIDVYSCYYILIGGIVGKQKYGGQVYCYNTGNITAETTDRVDIGGIDGHQQDGYIEGIYNLGTITLKSDVGTSNIGGLIGTMYYTGTTRGGFNLGNVVYQGTNSPKIGSICGIRYLVSGQTVSDYYYLKGTAVGAINSNSLDGITEVDSISSQTMADVLNGKKNDYAEYILSTFKVDVSDILGTWTIESEKNNGYPILEN